MSAPATRSSRRLCRDGDENVELQLMAGCRGVRELPRLNSDADRILQQPTDADRKRALHDSVQKWQDGAAFEQCWIGKLLIDVYPLPPAAFDGPAYLRPPSSYQHESPLQRPLYRLLKSRNQRTTLRQSDLCGYGMLLRVMPQNKPAGATAEQLAQLTAADKGEAVAGCALRLLLEVKLNGAVEGAHPTRHHSLYVQFAATKKGQEDRGYMRLLMLGQVRLMAALLPNSHASVNSIFINSTVLSDESFRVYRKKFGFARDISTRGFNSFDRLQMTHTRLCSQAVMVEVDADGEEAEFEQELYPVVRLRDNKHCRGSVARVRVKLAQDAAGAAAEAEVRDAVAEQASAKESIAPQHSALALCASAASAASSDESLEDCADRIASPVPSVKSEPLEEDGAGDAASSVVSFDPARMHLSALASARSDLSAAAVRLQPRASGILHPCSAAASSDAESRLAKRPRIQKSETERRGATPFSASSAFLLAAASAICMPPLEAAAEPSTFAAVLSLAAAPSSARQAQPNSERSNMPFRQRHKAMSQISGMEIKQEPIDSSPASASPSADTASSPSRGRAREVIDLVNSDDDDDDAATLSSVATATGAAEQRVKLESALIELLPSVKLEAIAVMRGALPKLSEVQLWQLLSAHGHDAAAAIQAHILAQFAIGRPSQPQ